jgi:hypothetical protein
MKKEKAHAKLSASGSEIWLECPGSVSLSEKAPPKTETIYMAEGTKAHKLLELWLLHILKTSMAFIIPKGYPKEMVGAVKIAVKEIEKRWNRGKNGTLIPERKIYLTNVGPEMWGTADVTILEHYGLLTVLDYKHGSGHVVEIEDPTTGALNTQAIYYALGAADEQDWDFIEAEIGIIQPRALHHAGAVRTKRIPIKQLKKYEDVFKKGVDEVNKPKPYFKFGPHCLWCVCKPICSEYKKSANNAAALAFAGLE